MTVRVRYAPSPTGSPHVGNLRTAIYNWLLARKEGGQFLARLEDTDRAPGRYCPEGIWEIEEGLRFLGITPDEWWVSGGPCAPYVQSERLDIYREHAERLVASGHAYRCYCTKERLEAMRRDQHERNDPSGYDRRCRRLSPEQRAQNDAAALPHVVRLAMPEDGTTIVRDLVHGEIKYDNRTMDDQVLLKSDGYPTYFLACVVDDHLMGITHIIRGDDWLASAPKFVSIFDAFGWQPPLMAHPPLIIGPDRKKLSKRHGATQFSEFMRAGYLPEALVNFLVLLGWSPGEDNQELFTISELIQRFSLEGITAHPAVFDYDKLKWMNGHYIRASQPGRILGMCLPYLSKAGLIGDPPSQEETEYARRVVPLEIDRMKQLSEAPDRMRFFFAELRFPVGYDDRAVRKWLHVPYLKPLLTMEIERFGGLPEWTAPALDECTMQIAAQLSVAPADAIHPTRVAATGQTVGPGLFDTLHVLGRDRTLTRLGAVLEAIGG